MVEAKRERLVAGNWKMNMGREEGLAFARSLLDFPLGPDLSVALFPPFTLLSDMSPHFDPSRGRYLGAQNLHACASGAYTGEISGEMIRPLATMVLVGHSERRHQMGEDDALIRQKVRRALDADLAPVICVGETLEEREAGQMSLRLRTQLLWALEGIEDACWGRVRIAYEPVWAIGTGRTALPEQAREAHALIHETLVGLHPQRGGDVPVLYGGSVKADNAAELMGQDGVDGLLVGGASLQWETFSAILRSSR